MGNSTTIKINSMDQMKFIVPCVICGKTIREYDYPFQSIAEVCDDCKDAVRFAKLILNSARKRGGDAD